MFDPSPFVKVHFWEEPPCDCSHRKIRALQLPLGDLGCHPRVNCDYYAYTFELIFFVQDVVHMDGSLPQLYIMYIIHIIQGSLEVKLPTIWTVGKAEVGRVREEKKRNEKIREEKK